MPLVVLETVQVWGMSPNAALSTEHLDPLFIALNPTGFAPVSTNSILSVAAFGIGFVVVNLIVNFYWFNEFSI